MSEAHSMTPKDDSGSLKWVYIAAKYILALLSMCARLTVILARSMFFFWGGSTSG